ncbi:hypothetical protein FBZ88_110187 [Nitrospirillum bahiense]|uniref:Uncharacterized protein n=1 Tax=Nitrospirillum amazonense TaxID=28077 RepID=A0A560FVA7_9PROT|nr:hypothetical protein FBZ88_110187 [Nitrospirillum amazonense]
MLTALICPPWPPPLLAPLASLSPVPEPPFADDPLPLAAWVAGVVVVVVEPSE